jgi:hypothetical protein
VGLRFPQDSATGQFDFDLLRHDPKNLTDPLLETTTRLSAEIEEAEGSGHSAGDKAGGDHGVVGGSVEAVFAASILPLLP